LSKLARWDWNLEKSIATATHNSEPLDHLERRLAAPAVKREAGGGLERPVTAQILATVFVAKKSLRDT
jgi:hypothetical protein